MVAGFTQPSRLPSRFQPSAAPSRTMSVGAGQGTDNGGSEPCNAEPSTQVCSHASRNARSSRMSTVLSGAEVRRPSRFDSESPVVQSKAWVGSPRTVLATRSLPSTDASAWSARAITPVFERFERTTMACTSR